MEEAKALPVEITELLARVVETPGGFRLLCSGCLESVAVMFHAPARLIDHVRELLEDPRTRASVARALVEARREHHLHPHPIEAPHAPAHVAKQVDELLREAERCPGGIELLLQAPLETAAILFGAHPFVVQQARERLGPNGLVPKSGGEQTG